MLERDNFTYKDIEEKYSENNYFDVVEIIIPLRVTDPDIMPDDSYFIEKLRINFDDEELNTELKQGIKNEIDLINNEIELNREKGNSEWNIFYLYKELIQKLNHDDNYYRGQVTNWPMLPGILRKTTNDELKNNFENLYQDIMYRYPNEIYYFDPIADPNVIKERELQLAYLQHYGMNTSLLDITENPYIALLFMITDSNNHFCNATFEIYRIKKSIHTFNNLYSRVKMLKSNQRIIAQKGAFLNFDKVSLFTFNREIEKIFMLRITLEYSFEELESLKKMNSELEIQLNKRFSDRSEETEGKYEYDFFELYKKIGENRETIEQKERYFKEGFLDSIKTKIKKKLLEYHYKESELFPDLFKYISYRQRDYIAKNDHKIRSSHIHNEVLDSIEDLL